MFSVVVPVSACDLPVQYCWLVLLRFFLTAAVALWLSRRPVAVLIDHVTHIETNGLELYTLAGNRSSGTR